MRRILSAFMDEELCVAHRYSSVKKMYVVIGTRDEGNQRPLGQCFNELTECRKLTAG